MSEYKLHRLWAEFDQQLRDDLDFANMYDDTEEDFLAWVMDYELNSDWEAV